MEARRAVLLVGGPDAGKTNYLVRLWLAIDRKIGRLQADRSPDDLEYLMSGAEIQLGGKFVPHTPREVNNRSVIPVRDANTTEGVSGTLIVPDYSGEEWMEIYRKREWSEDWESLISDVCGCLLFVRVDSNQLVSPLDWVTCEKTFSSVPAAMSYSPESGTPTQAVLVDWLQCLRQAFTDRVGGHFRPRIGIVIAAWDLVPADRQADGPDRYLAAEFPMLEQFMQSNTDRFNFGVFGVSIFGGDPENEPDFLAKYLNDPIKAGYVIQSVNGVVNRSGDLTLPVAWAMGFQDEID